MSKQNWDSGPTRSNRGSFVLERPRLAPELNPNGYLAKAQRELAGPSDAWKRRQKRINASIALDWEKTGEH
jgi:hypothetical protein